MSRISRAALAGLGVAALITVAACGGGGGGGSSSAAPTTSGAPTSSGAPTTSAAPIEPAELTAILAAPSGIAFYPLVVGQAKGYFGEGLTVTTEAADSSGSALQQVLAGQADICVCSPGPGLKAVEEGADLVSVYTLYQSDVFALLTTPETGVTTAEDLRGKIIGVDAIGGGAESWLVPLMSAQGLKLGIDYEIIATGPGAAPIAAFARGDIQAYAAAFIDTAVLKLQGLTIEKVELPGSEVFFDAVLIMKKEYVDANPAVIEALGKGVAMSTVLGETNPAEVLSIIGEQFPDEVSDMPFAEALLAETQSLYALPPAAEGKWGYSVPARHDALIAALLEQGYLTTPVSPTFFDNQFVDAYNDFDPATIN
jgi:NitT/TauT family transport system substrate-binding protein